MRNTARLADAVRRTALRGAGAVRGLGAVRGPARAGVLAGAGLALVGAGSASAATVMSGSHTPVVASHVAPAGAAARTAGAVTGGPGQARSSGPATEQVSVQRPATWSQIEQKVASQTSHEPKAADQLQPVGATGAQAYMPITGAQHENARTIVKQALAKKMGLRSAVIAVATAMQESRLQNIDYGTSQSLGLFQQQTGMGWGSARQIMNPAYSADAFLSALQQYQASNPGWARQPLWQSAQGVQKSGVPFAYAKWEAQAAHLVQQAVRQMV